MILVVSILTHQAAMFNLIFNPLGLLLSILLPLHLAHQLSSFHRRADVRQLLLTAALRHLSYHVLSALQVFIPRHADIGMVHEQIA